MGHDDLRTSRQRGRRRRAGASVVNDDGHVREELRVIDIAHGDAGVAGVARTEISPSAREHDATTERARRRTSGPAGTHAKPCDSTHA